MKEAEILAQNGHIVTFGIKPDYAETGFGYICAEGTKVTKFAEKPDRDTAENILQMVIISGTAEFLCSRFQQ